LNAINAGEKEEKIKEYCKIFKKPVILNDSYICICRKISDNLLDLT
jgi:hypothetical protein